MRLKKFNFTPATANLIGYASNVTGASFTLTANVSGDSLAHIVSIRNDAAVDHSGKTITLVGFDENGKAVTDVVTGPGVSATVNSVKFFSYLTSATPSATIGADTFDIGWTNSFASNHIPLNWRNMTVAGILTADVTGTINYTVSECVQNILAGQTPVWNAITALTTKTADVLAASPSMGATGLRVVANTYSASAVLDFYVNQPDWY